MPVSEKLRGRRTAMLAVPYLHMLFMPRCFVFMSHWVLTTTPSIALIHPIPQTKKAQESYLIIGLVHGRSDIYIIS